MRILPLVLVVVAVMTTVPYAQADRASETRYVGAFFYPSYGHIRGWYAPGFDPPTTWASHYLPDFKPVGFEPLVQLYKSAEEDTLRWQLGLMHQAGLDFTIASWWGPRSFEDEVLRKIFKLAGEENASSFSPLTWCLLYEKEGQGEPSLAEILTDLTYVEQTYGDSNAYFRLNGKLVLFVMGERDEGVQYAEKWREVRNRTRDFYFVLRVFPGFIDVTDYADSWFQYSPENRFEFHESYAAFASPGFWRYSEEPRLERDESEFATALMRLYYEPVQFLLIETWNNWMEGTQIEPAYQVANTGGKRAPSAPSYGTTYIDLVRKILKGEEHLTTSLSGPGIVAAISSSLAAGLVITLSVAKILWPEKRSRLLLKRR